MFKKKMQRQHAPDSPAIKPPRQEKEVNHATVFTRMFTAPGGPSAAAGLNDAKTAAEPPGNVFTKIDPEILQLPVGKMDLSERTNAVLGEAGVRNIGELITALGTSLMQNLSREERSEIYEALDDLRPTPAPTLRDIMKKPVSDLELSVRAANGFDRAGIVTVGELVSKTEDDLLGIRWIGIKTVEEIKRVLAGMGLKLKMETDGRKSNI